MSKLFSVVLLISFIWSYSAKAHGEVFSPIPHFRVVAIHAAPGVYVESGTNLMELDLMKMRYSIVATQSGIVDHINVQVGQRLTNFLGPLLVIKYPLPDIKETTLD